MSKGGAGARNDGISCSRGEWIAFLDDDDEWMPTKLESQLGALNANLSAVACSCSFVRRFPSGASRLVVVPENVTLRQVLSGSVLGGASMCLCSSNVLREIGGFDPDFRSGQDWDLWARLRQKGVVTTCRESLVLYHAHEGSRITNNMQAQYVGARHFYFKYRCLMDASLRRHRVSYCCFIMSRQVARGFRRRIRYLILSLLNSSPWDSLTYARSSIPRLIRDAFARSLNP
jgi:glycosyltransferase involved in cell wall biosynthesis